MFSAMFDENKKLRIYIPTLIFLVAAVITSFFVMQFSALQQEQVYPLIAEAYGNDFVAYFKNMVSAQSTVVIATSSISIFIMPFIIALVQSGVVMLICKAFFKSEMLFKRFYAFMLYVNMVSILGSVLTVALGVLVTDSAANIFALGILMDYTPTSFAYNFLSSITIFSILEYVLIFIGINYYAKLEKAKGQIAAVICIAIMLLGTAGMALMSTGNPVDQYRTIYEMYEKSNQ